MDVSIQAQILNLFMDLRAVQHICDRIVVMYLGRIVEDMPARGFMTRANHPYTKALLAEIPDLDNRTESYNANKGEIPSPIDPPSGCHFHPRCPHAFDRRRVERPVLKSVENKHLSACHLNDNKAEPALPGHPLSKEEISNE